MAQVRAARLRAWLGERLRHAADRIDYDGAPKIIRPYSFTFEEGEGIRFREDGKGCHLAYLGGEANYRRAHDESDTTTRRRAEWDAIPEDTRQILRAMGDSRP
jgi:hypothetical protein